MKLLDSPALFILPLLLPCCVIMLDIQYPRSQAGYKRKNTASEVKVTGLADLGLLPAHSYCVLVRKDIYVKEFLLFTPVRLAPLSASWGFQWCLKAVHTFLGNKNDTLMPLLVYSNEATTVTTLLPLGRGGTQHISLIVVYLSPQRLRPLVFDGLSVFLLCMGILYCGGFLNSTPM